MIDLAGRDEVLATVNPLGGARAVVPDEVLLEGDSLLWRPGEPWHPGDPVEDYGLWGFRRGEPVEGMLWAFLGLIDASPEAYEGFARRFGVLAIRSGGRPESAPFHGPGNDLPPTVERDGQRWYVEPIGAWRIHAVALRGFLAFSIAARRDDPIDGEAVLHEYGLDRSEWGSFGMPEMYDDTGSVTGLYREWLRVLNPRRLALILDGRPSIEARAILGREFSRTWLSWAALVPSLTWDRVPTLTLQLGSRPDGLMFPPGMAFSVIVGQALAVLSSDGFERLAQCALCGQLFEPLIRPGRHIVAYCPEHKLEGDRERKRRWARRQARTRRSDSQNM